MSASRSTSRYGGGYRPCRTSAAPRTRSSPPSSRPSTRRSGVTWPIWAPGPDPHRSRVTGGYRIQGAWSVRLRTGGFHADHFHPQGWISSAFYVETPDRALDRETREGWIRFGRPPIDLDPTLEAEHYVRPEPGRLVLFPSYMWHGTVPFTTEELRMTVAFDLVPARRHRGA